MVNGALPAWAIWWLLVLSVLVVTALFYTWTATSTSGTQQRREDTLRSLADALNKQASDTAASSCVQAGLATAKYAAGNWLHYNAMDGADGAEHVVYRHLYDQERGRVAKSAAKALLSLANKKAR